MSINNPQGLSVITVPMKMKRQIEKIKKFKEIAKKNNEIKLIRKGDTSKPIIICKNKKLNHHRGQTYGKFDAVSLASFNWQSSKSSSDFFTILNHSQNPAFVVKDDSSSSFEDLGLDLRLVEQLKKNGFENPTNIQKLAIPSILDELNTVVAAETGNGKTLTFLAPIIHQILQSKEGMKDLEPAFNTPQALIIVPSRELVIQTRDMARSLCDDLGIRINSITGGSTKLKMLNPKSWEHDLVIGSFGALSKLFTSRVYRKQRVNHIVLDEADTLLDDSFNEQMKHFLSMFALKENINDQANKFTGVQLSLVGATFPRSMNSILKGVIDVDALKHIKSPYLHRISPHVIHKFYRVKSSSLIELLIKLARNNFNKNIPTIIFSNTSDCSNFVYHLLNDNQLPCINVNGNMEAHSRINRFQRFQDGEFNFISCTDLVSRGLNTVRAQQVINFEFPSYISDYIHRCGRTGRVGGKEGGQVINFISKPYDVDIVQKIEYAARKVVELENVNANIKRSVNVRVAKREEQQQAMETAEDDARQMDEEIRKFQR